MREFDKEQIHGLLGKGKVKVHLPQRKPHRSWTIERPQRKKRKNE